MDRRYIVLGSIVAIMLVGSILILGIPTPSTEEENGPPDIEGGKRFSLMTLFANSAEVNAEETMGFYLSQEQVIGQNSTVVIVGDVNSTKSLDGLKFGCFVEWNDNVGEVWLSLLLRFPVPQQFIYNISGNHQAFNLTGFDFNVSFYMNVFHNSSFTFKLITPAWVLADYGLPPSWWISKTGSGNQTFLVSTIVNESEYYAPVIEDGEVIIKFSIIVNGVSGYLTQCFVDLTTIEIFQLGS